MFEKIRKMKNQKGFTLVELIVVLVILAILAAMLVPALTGYIDKANEEKVIATTRQVVMAAQAEVSEKYASNTLTGAKIVISDKAKPDYTPALGTGAKAEVAGEEIVKLAEVATVKDDLTCEFKNGISKITINYDAKGHVNDVTVSQGTKHCKYTEATGKYEIVASHS